ncbi:alpha/beta hydrolase [Xylocopilactobacillus apis]|uniref:Dienelactone hydrolase domain-containing protein n=1 Tax=Xylocopilactobacillus apis TaxID=2932183 RepID=A0AAU9DGM3_9LACO|nr:alpha/beta hydrolase [Xylocopilactobacillus apis]BDR57421.1 hypothetical protein KIMC2_19830 [Xylocopilactobacillus apis]
MTTNKFGLVYEDAITENKPGKVNIHPVNYLANGVKAAANVYTPADYDESSEKLYPAVTVAHPNGGVKEQVAGLFAQKLAENGYIAIAADASYQGASDGLPRNTDRPSNRIEDIRAMADFLDTFPGVDPKRIGTLGICGGGGYTIEAAKTDKRLKAVATISMFNSGRVRRNGFKDSQLDSVQERLRQAADARIQEILGNDVQYTGEMAKMTDEELAALPFDLYRDGYDYYQVTHKHPNSTGRYPVSNLIYLAEFDAEDHADLIDQPLLMMAGDQADTLYMTEAVYDKATGTDNKELFLIKGAKHIDTYWKHPYVDQEADKLIEFYEKNL